MLSLFMKVCSCKIWFAGLFANGLWRAYMRRCASNAASLPATNGFLMIICHCNKITDKEILEIGDGIAQENPDAPIHSNQIYQQRGCKAKCGCCRPMIEALLLRDGHDVAVARTHEIAKAKHPHFHGAPNDCPGFS